MIETKHLFTKLDEQLISLLKSLTPEEWNKQTLAKRWKVKDVAAHLLDGNMRMLALRDGHFLEADREINSYSDLVDYLNQLNADWIRASARISPRTLTELLEITGREYSDYIKTLDDQAQAVFPVAWAGETVSKNWFHIAREFTEKWHHQQQIREAVGEPGILTKEFFYPFLDTLLCALPYTYRKVTAKTGTTISIEILSEAGGKWFLVKTKEAWEISKQSVHEPDASISISRDTAWKLFTRGLSPQEALQKVSINGSTDLAKIVLELVAVMA